MEARLNVVVCALAILRDVCRRLRRGTYDELATAV
jgi:hypothetical protein